MLEVLKQIINHEQEEEPLIYKEKRERKVCCSWHVRPLNNLMVEDSEFSIVMKPMQYME